MRIYVRSLALIVVVASSTAASADDSLSALERDPAGWTDLLAQAGPKLEGWARGTIPPGGKVNPRSQWSLDPATGILLCQGDGGHEWLRWDKELADCIYHVEWRFTVVPGKKGYNSGIYARNSADATIWHQAQTGDASGGYLFGNTAAGRHEQALEPLQAAIIQPGQTCRRVEYVRDFLPWQGNDTLGQRSNHQSLA